MLEWTDFTFRRSTSTVNGAQLPLLFPKPRNIDEEKWKDLQFLKTVLPKDTHFFYDSIGKEPKKPKKTKKNSKSIEEN